ncbi:phosphotransferase enzyme family protein [Neotabrizicola shimadae]|uniref:Homoserine kinase n=1 Tax=Neotabrizicola shimadae TaxID=2807096 RepID=A0A8G0ZUX1_9RHOB|nr:homoserine kinase [Neotabrizicola shimadae]QYZ69351.1 homoserine kinase [Neotabrizicola shimadae]
MSDPVPQALALWGLSGAAHDFVAGRENRVYRVRSGKGDFALRIKRPGYRTRPELESELQWLRAMHDAGLSVPLPERSLSGAFLEQVEGFDVDLIGWLDGRPLGHSGTRLDLNDAPGTFGRLGEQIARLHDACDAWRPAAGFTRCAWDLKGLLGETPIWGRFWENPTLTPDQRDILARFRQRAHQELTATLPDLDHGLIHADLVRENVLIDGDRLHLIDFDDGGFGFRLFDIATALLKNMAEPDYPMMKAALLDGYRTRRPLDTDRLDLFMALRAVTYVGWIIPRMQEDQAPARNRRFIADADRLCRAYLGA